MHWIILILIAALFLGLYNFFIKLASNHIHHILGAVILQAVAFLLGGLALLFLRVNGQAFPSSSKGVWLAVAAGAFVGLAEIISFVAFSKGAPATIGIPMLVGGTILVGVILGQYWLKEPLKWQDYAGLLFILGGIGLLAMKK